MMRVIIDVVVAATGTAADAQKLFPISIFTSAKQQQKKKNRKKYMQVKQASKKK